MASEPKPLKEVADRYKAHNDAIRRSQQGLSAPPGKKCIEEGCNDSAFPWEKRCKRHEKKHQRALRSANRKECRAVVPCSPYAFEQFVCLAEGGAR